MNYALSMIYEVYKYDYVTWLLYYFIGYAPNMQLLFISIGLFVQLCVHLNGKCIRNGQA